MERHVATQVAAGSVIVRTVTAKAVARGSPRRPTFASTWKPMHMRTSNNRYADPGTACKSDERVVGSAQAAEHAYTCRLRPSPWTLQAGSRTPSSQALAGWIRSGRRCNPWGSPRVLRRRVGVGMG